MKHMNQINPCRIAVALLVVSFGLGTLPSTARAELSREEVKDLAVRIERATDDFKKTIERKLGRAKGEESKLKDKINKQVSKLETAADKLKREVSGDKKGVLKTLGIRADIKRVVDEAGGVDKIIRVGKWDTAIKLDWVRLRTAVNVLAEKYNLDKINEKD